MSQAIKKERICVGDVVCAHGDVGAGEWICAGEEGVIYIGGSAVVGFHGRGIAGHDRVGEGEL